MPDLPILEVPHPYEGLPKDKVEQIADSMVEKVCQALTQPAAEKPRAS
ncbi:MAG: hypothetical protein AAB502_09210 [Chloroflexota bacterium]